MKRGSAVRAATSTALAVLVNVGLFGVVIALNGEVGAAVPTKPPNTQVLHDRPPPPPVEDVVATPKDTPPARSQAAAPPKATTEPALDLAAPTFDVGPMGVATGQLDLPVDVSTVAPVPPPKTLRKSSYRSDELDEPVRAIVLHKGEYPRQARKHGISGRVVVRIHIDERGQVYDARVLSGPPVLAQAFVADLRLSQFTVPTRGGKPVRSVRDIPRTYRLPGGS